MADESSTLGAPPQVQDRFGRIAIQLGFITHEQLEEAVSVQRAAAKAGFRKRLGDILVRKGYITSEQVQKILNGQTADAKSNRVGDYEIMSKLGEGGMGAVYKAKQRGIERLVALKILAPHLAKDPEFRERFVREARAVAKLNHPNIVAGIDVGTDRGLYYFAMEFVDGQSLGSLLHKRGGTLPEREALEFTRQVALALHHAHTHGLLHRDVKPENILIGRDGQTKLADLGLARSARRDEDAGMTSAGMAVGTPYYISPEQARGMSDLTAGTDLYSLGATLYHLLTGKHVFEGPTGAVIMAKHVGEKPPDPRDENPELSKRTAQLVVKLLQKEPKDRCKDGQQLADELQAAIEACGSSSKQPARGSKDTPEPESNPDGAGTTNIRAVRLTRRRRETDVSGGLLAGLGVVVGLALVALFMFPGGGSRPAYQPSRPKPAPIEDPLPRAAQPAKTPAKGAEKKTSAEDPGKSGAPAGLELVPPADQAPELAPLPEKPATPETEKLESVDAQGLFDGMSELLKAERFQDALRLVENYRKSRGNNKETAEMADMAIALTRQVAQAWSAVRKELNGKTIQLGADQGMAGNLTETGFEFTVKQAGGPSMTRPAKWSEIPAHKRLELAGFPAGKPDNQAERGFYLLYMGHAKEGIASLHNAEKNGQIAIPIGWRQMLERLAPRDDAEAPAPKPPPLAAKTTEPVESPKPEPAKPVSPAVKFEQPKSIAQLFKGKTANLSPNALHVELHYDFSNANQLEDFKGDDHGTWELKDGALVMSGPKGQGRQLTSFSQRARWLGNQPFKIVARMMFEETFDGAGVALRDRFDPGAGRFIALAAGGMGGGGGANSGSPRGIGIRMSENNSSGNPRLNWNYDTGKAYLFVLVREGEKWSAKENTWEIENRKRKDITEEWSGHGAVWSRGTRVRITELRISGVLDPEWVKEALGGK